MSASVFAALTLATNSPWEAALERSAVVFDRPNGGPCVRTVRVGGNVLTRNFTTGRPEYVMPVGAGNLSAMVSFGAEAWEFHLSQADYCDESGMLVSPGHLRIRFDGLSTNDIMRFAQRMDLLRGRVTLAIETPRGRIDGEAFGDRRTGALVVFVRDARRNVAPPQADAVLKPGRPPARIRPSGEGLKIVLAAEGDAADRALAADLAAQRAAVCDWWRDYWSRGWIALEGDARAERLTALWYANLYVFASVGFGGIPPKFNGGPGILFDDERTWGPNFWWQNSRELIWPLAVANRCDFARRYLEFYSGFSAGLAGGRDFGVAYGTGAWRLPETAELARHALFVGARRSPEPLPDAPYAELSDADRAKLLEERRAQRGRHTSHVYSSGTEYLQQLIDYLRFTGDRTLLPHVAKWLRSQTELYLQLCTREADGQWHVRCTNVNESWLKADDSIVDLLAARYCFAQTVAHGREFGFPKPFIDAASRRLESLADLPRGRPYVDYHAETGVRFVNGPEVYHPCVLTNGMRKVNFENNELYIVHPFAMAKADEEGPLRQLAIDTYLNGPKRNGDSGWTPVSVAVARLRLTNAVDVVYGHAVRSCLWPFGGGISPGHGLYTGAGGLGASVYMDSTGVMQTGVQELLLQSHAEEPDPSFYTGGPVRFIPCVPESWSGAFKLRARGGFVITASFRKGRLLEAEVLSERGGEFTWIDPGTHVRHRRQTVPGGTFVVHPDLGV